MMVSMRLLRTMWFLVVSLCSWQALAASLVVKVNDGSGAPLPDAVVYLDSGLPYQPGETRHYEVEQRNKTFAPFVTIIAAGSQASFPNHDGIGHHVYSFSPAKNFQLPLSEVEITDAITFDQPGIVTLGCNIHDWMVAYIYVVETPYFAKVGSDGVASIGGLPAGDYEIRVAHPGMKAAQPASTTVSLPAEGAVNLEFSLEIKPKYFWQPEARMHEEVY